MTRDEALKLALEFIERVNKDGWILADFEPQMYAAITAIKEVLAQPEQEPVAWMDEDGDVLSASIVDGKGLRNIPLYTTPPQRTWIGLTDEDISKISQRLGIDHDDSWTDLKQAIEAKLKEKNT